MRLSVFWDRQKGRLKLCALVKLKISVSSDLSPQVGRLPRWVPRDAKCGNQGKKARQQEQHGAFPTRYVLSRRWNFDHGDFRARRQGKKKCCSPAPVNGAVD